MAHLEDRPIMTCPELRALAPAALHSQRAWLAWTEFLKFVQEVHGYSLTRRTLQLYSSPKLRLVPLPSYLGGHIAHYRHPEDTLRLGVTLHLRSYYCFSLQQLKEVMRGLSPKNYPVVVRNGLMAGQIRLLAHPAGRDIPPCELIFMHMLGLLNVVETQDQFATDGPLDTPQLLAAEARFRSWLEGRAGIAKDALAQDLAWSN